MPKHTSLNCQGFTLIEIIIVLILLGILSAIAVPKFFDLQDDAESKAVLVSVAEMQSRLDATFSTKILEGIPCAEAVTYVSQIANLADDGNQKFGDFSFTADSGELNGSLSLKYSRNGSEWKDVVGASLVVPQCAPDSPALSPTFSQVGLDVWKAMMDGAFDVIAGLNTDSDPYFYSSRAGHERYYWVKFQNKAAGEGVRSEYQYYVEIGKNKDEDFLREVVVKAQWGTEFGTQNDNLLKVPSEQYAATREARIELFKTHCANWETFFEIATSEQGYHYLVPK